MKTRVGLVVVLISVGVLVACGDGGETTDPGPVVSVVTSEVATTVADTTAPETTVVETTAEVPPNPVANVVFSGTLETTSDISGTLFFVVTEAGQIDELNLDAALSKFDCGGGMTRSISGAATYFFPDPIVVEGGRFSRFGPYLSWSGEFETPTSAKGTIGIDGGLDCANKPPIVAWTAITGG